MNTKFSIVGIFIIYLSFIFIAFQPVDSQLETSTVNCQFFINSTGGSNTSITCNQTDPCTSLVQLTQVLNSTAITDNCTNNVILVSEGEYWTDNAFFGNISQFKSLTFMKASNDVNVTFSTNSRVMEFVGVDYKVDIKGFTFKGSKTFDGNNSVSDGGLLSFKVCRGQVTVEESTFIQGFARDNGGAIYLDTSGSKAISDCQFISNTAHSSSGGAIYVSGGSPDISYTDTNFTFNTAGGNGGALFSAGGNIVDCNFYENLAIGNGGGLYTFSSRIGVTIMSTNFTVNSAVQGGGLWISTSNASSYLTDVIIKRNVATNQGGGIYFYESNASLVSTSVYNNSASSNGGGIYADGLGSSAVVSIIDSSLRDNYAGGYGGGIYCNTTIINYNATTELKYNLDGSGEGGEGIAFDNIFCDDFCSSHGSCQRCECSECKDCPTASACTLASHDDGDICTCYVTEQVHEKECHNPLSSSSFPSSPASPHSKAGVIVGVIFAVLIVTMIISGVVYFYYRRRQNSGYTRILLDENSSMAHHL